MSLRTIAFFLAVPCIAPPAILACDRGSAKQEAAALTEAVDRFSRVSGPAQAKTVDGVPCTDDRVCEAKRVCMEAVDPTAHALALKDEVSAKLADIEAARLAPDAAAAEELPGKLDEASRLLREGHAKMHDCDAKLTDLKMTYGF
jgi:hypothetical protein